ncbi:MAG TPA: hypothetical protein VMH22_03775 [bacterium]|nr:hypothetical protein [bacterium]
MMSELLRGSTPEVAVPAAYVVTLVLTRRDSSHFSQGRGVAALFKQGLDARQNGLVDAIVAAIEKITHSSVAALDEHTRYKYVTELSRAVGELTTEDDPTLTRKVRAQLTRYAADPLAK